MEISKESIIIDKRLTESVYTVLELQFEDLLIKGKCLEKIRSAIMRNNIDFGIDYNKPWETIDIDDHYQIEYLFCGQIMKSKSMYISDKIIGINIYNETNFGALEFGTDKILNLTLIIEK